MTDHLNRDNKDFAIEFGGYLANAAEHFIVALNENMLESAALDDDVIRDHWAALQSAIYEFRTRAALAQRAPAIQRRAQDILTIIRQIARS